MERETLSSVLAVVSKSRWRLSIRVKKMMPSTNRSIRAMTHTGLND